ncbi:MAG: 30S ribosomal protein S12 methylthiotransferase RimO, partial [Oscillospiraceae bacterium]|nr:30S ribosomal protein S12 methylthiotransferase RimO [Oscillospiraceae bacterium]
MPNERVAFVSLGCAKNLVNTEQMMALAMDGGYTVTGDPETAEVAVVNTCGFIDSAKSEAIDVILELAKQKETGKLRGILVAGCMVQRHGTEVQTLLPEVDGLLGCGSYGEITRAIEEVLNGEKPQFFGDINAPIQVT